MLIRETPDEMIPGRDPIESDRYRRDNSDETALLDPCQLGPEPSMTEGREPDEIERPDLKRSALLPQETRAKRQQSVHKEERECGEDYASACRSA